ncbi:MAG: outer membrane protein [Acidobacteriota bacterium]|nr:outer membrane protein [Acidobacteriota bacterium]
MKHIRSVAAAALICAALVSAAHAQQPPASAAKPSLEGKVAVIDTSAFADEQTGIRRIVEALRRIEGEFTPRSNELQQMRARYDQLVKEINDTKTVADQPALQRKADEAEQLKRDIERKSEDAKAAYEKRLHEVVGPVQDEVFKSLDAYAKEYGISIIIDASQVPLIYGAQSVDITQHFINIYNQRNPAAAGAATTPAAPRPAATRPATTGTPSPRRP